eukprot:TRINITY_DN3028_c0_g4_i1.p5 TRINITY_DN3028_c0_g4~~TRINITY_DN3028_c0_g4_i1.p5  ORF type:complete len:108 (-),score=41.79 TRINITY_DN3028_c0_g4_i1:508-831(-)
MLMDAIHKLTDTTAAIPATRRRLRDLESTVALHPTRRERELSQTQIQMQGQLEEEVRRHEEEIARIQAKGEADREASEARLAKELAEAQAELPRVREQMTDLFVVCV